MKITLLGLAVALGAALIIVYVVVAVQPRKNEEGKAQGLNDPQCPTS